MSLILDGIIIFIVLLFVYLSAKKGFVYTLIEVIGFVAALVIAFTISTPLAEITYDTFVFPSVSDKVESTGKENISEAADALWEELPDYFTESSFLGLSKETATTAAQNEFSNNSDSIAKSISDSMVKPTAVKLISVFISFILVVVLLFIVKILAKYINKLFTFSVVGEINKILGGVLGIAKGAAIAVVFCLVISLILSFTKDGFLIFTYDAIESSYLFKFLMGFSPFV